MELEEKLKIQEKEKTQAVNKEFIDESGPLRKRIMDLESKQNLLTKERQELSETLDELGRHLETAHTFLAELTSEKLALESHVKGCNEKMSVIVNQNQTLQRENRELAMELTLAGQTLDELQNLLLYTTQDIRKTFNLEIPKDAQALRAELRIAKQVIEDTEEEKRNQYLEIEDLKKSLQERCLILEDQNARIQQLQVELSESNSFTARVSTLNDSLQNQLHEYYNEIQALEQKNRNMSKSVEINSNLLKDIAINREEMRASLDEVQQKGEAASKEQQKKIERLTATLHETQEFLASAINEDTQQKKHFINDNVNSMLDHELAEAHVRKMEAEQEVELLHKNKLIEALESQIKNMQNEITNLATGLQNKMQEMEALKVASVRN